MDKIDLFKDVYSLSLGSMKWISKGGDILRYVGQNVILVKFSKKSEESEWETTNSLVNVISISGYNKETGTYQIAWKEGDSEIQTERLTPEGFSFNVPERDLWMHRFLPLSLHMKITEETLAYERFKNLYETRESMSLDKIGEYYRSDQKETIGYRNYVSLIVDTSDGINVGITECRIKCFSSLQISNGQYLVSIKDMNNNLLILKIPEKNFTDAFKIKFDGTYIGMGKIIEIQE